MNTSIRRTPITFKSVSNKLGEYRVECAGRETFRGFLLYCGLRQRHFDEMRDILSDAKDPKRSRYFKVAELLQDYKDELEVRMEEIMIYQDQHPSMAERPNYNYKNLEFVLKASNPQKYSNKVYKEDSSKKSGSDIKLLKNESSLHFDTD